MIFWTIAERSKAKLKAIPDYFRKSIQHCFSTLPFESYQQALWYG